MALHHLEPVEQSQRIQVDIEPSRHDRRVKIRLENFDEFLGWYTSGSLSLELHQLPLLEQAVETMRSYTGPEEDSEGKVIPFPGACGEIAGEAS